ncbi:hypothetical protein [Dokdonella sp.]|uniref:hypothetical protein n=1 Tax=Dokdonella sp. TaxID=2291710 RepID=UPI00352981E3
MPGLRWEGYSLDAKPDAIWLEDNPDTAIADVDSTQWTPKLGLRLHCQRECDPVRPDCAGLSGTAVSDVNVGLYLPGFNYLVKPNPDLKPEESLGFRWDRTGAVHR